MRLLLRRAARAMGQQRVWIMIALVLDAAIAVTGVLIGPSFNMAGLLAVGPLLACARCNGRMTALVAGYALADVALADLDGAVKRVVRLLLEHAGGELTDDVLLVLAEPVADAPSVI